MTEKKWENTIAETFQTECFNIGDVLYVPMYGDKYRFVGPGYGKQHMNSYSLDFMLGRLDATKVVMMLWKRGEPGCETTT